jgi:hypothetical protein
MPMNLKKVVISSSGDTIVRTRSEVPEYLQRAIAESLERGKHDARQNVYVADRADNHRKATHE